jgi:hypothetical protein
MDTISIFFGCNEIKRLRYTLNYRTEHSKEIDIDKSIFFKLFDECDKK